MRRLKKQLFHFQRRQQSHDGTEHDKDTKAGDDATTVTPVRGRSYSSGNEYVGSLDAITTKATDHAERRVHDRSRSCTTLRRGIPLVSTSPRRLDRLRTVKRRIVNWFRRGGRARDDRVVAAEAADNNVYATVVTQPAIRAMEAIRRPSDESSTDLGIEASSYWRKRPDLIGLSHEERMCRMPLPGRLGTQPDWVHEEGLRWFEAPLSLTPVTVTAKQFRNPERKKIHDPLGYRELVRCGWYWGPLNRRESEELLFGRYTGTFLVRDTSDYCHLYAISVVTSRGHVRHMLIEHNGLDSWSLYKDCSRPGKRSVVALIESYMEEANDGFGSIRSGEGLIFLTSPLSRLMRLRSLQDQCRFVIRMYTRFDLIKELPLPSRIKEYLLLDPL